MGMKSDHLLKEGVPIKHFAHKYFQPRNRNRKRNGTRRRGERNGCQAKGREICFLLFVKRIMGTKERWKRERVGHIERAWARELNVNEMEREGGINGRAEGMICR